jgi:hypothetical protein
MRLTPPLAKVEKHRLVRVPRRFPAVVHYIQSTQRQAMASDKLWVAGVELAQPASPGADLGSGVVDLLSPTPATRRCYPFLNQAK